MMREMRMTLIQWFSPDLRTMEVSPLCSGKEGLRESKCLLLVTHATLHSLPAVFLNWRRRKRKRQQTSHLLTPPPIAKPIRDQGQTAG